MELDSRYLIGVDESGTGAWAGPFTVGAVLIEVAPFAEALGSTVRDSKKMKDRDRRTAVPLILRHVIASKVISVPVDMIHRDGLKAGWRFAVVDSIRSLHEQVGSSMSLARVPIIIDGPGDKATFKMLNVNGWGPRIRFESKADDTYLAVSAASVLAKTERNDSMIALAKLYPEFGWEQSYGYGTPAHEEALRVHGVTDQHRPIRLLDEIGKVYEPSADWFVEE